ncbi:hypothetical protein [Sphingomonas oligoaromativorans]|uniref:hypothetical protein n=1 Tax=Sphingomonas oligoaromativorans TaxID=575322 RepID=UPI00142269E6|nr:hypothetical protein [Sphingomonas oligoaromativorans]NIJ34321.1 hypothetical protein [Sphingomonas oligoaromativorans]
MSDDRTPADRTPLSPDREIELRLECLRLACGFASSIVEAKASYHPTVVVFAQRYFEFITGASATPPREALDAALDAADVR